MSFSQCISTSTEIAYPIARSPNPPTILVQPKAEDLKEGVLPKAPTVKALEKEPEDEPKDIVLDVALKKPNWDLKRDIQKKARSSHSFHPIPALTGLTEGALCRSISWSVEHNKPLWN